MLYFGASKLGVTGKGQALGAPPPPIRTCRIVYVPLIALSIAVVYIN